MSRRRRGTSFRSDVRGKAEVTQWVIWQMANQGPKLGECGHFRRLGETKGDQSYAVRRFTDEANRLYGVLNNRLYDRRYLAGDAYTIADMISYPWATNWQAQGQDIDGVPVLQEMAKGTRRASGRPTRHGGRPRTVGGPGKSLRRRSAIAAPASSTTREPVRLPPTDSCERPATADDA